MSKLKTMAGIADAHGIESYVPAKEAQLGMLSIRAGANRQRHAVLYQVDMPAKGDKVVEKFIASGDYDKALIAIKIHGKNIRLAKQSLMGGMGNVEESWNLIPNPKLDPWR